MTLLLVVDEFSKREHTIVNSHGSKVVVRLPGTISKSEIYTGLVQSKSNLLRVFDVCLEIQNDCKRYFGFVEDEF